MKKADFTLLLCTSLVLLLGAGGLFYYSGRIQKSIGASSQHILVREAGTLSNSSQGQEITLPALELVKHSQSVTSELLLAIKWLAWALVAISLLQFTAIYSLYANGRSRKSNFGAMKKTVPNYSLHSEGANSFFPFSGLSSEGH